MSVKDRLAHIRPRKGPARRSNGSLLPRVGSLAAEISLIPGGFKEFARWVKLVPIREKKFKDAIKTFFELPISRQNGIELEEMCLNFRQSPAELLGMCVEIAYENKINIAKLIQSVAMPDVVKQNARQAKTVKGIEDRRMFMMSTNLLPTPGSRINISNTAQAASLTNNGEPTGVPDFEESTTRFSDIIRTAAEGNQPLLSEPIPDAVIADDDDEDSE